MASKRGMHVIKGKCIDCSGVDWLRPDSRIPALSPQLHTILMPILHRLFCSLVTSM